MSSTGSVPGEVKDAANKVVGARRKLRLAKKKTVRRILRKMGLRMRGGMSALSPAASGGGEEGEVGSGETPTGGRRHRSRRGTRRGRKSRRSLFGLIKY